MEYQFLCHGKVVPVTAKELQDMAIQAGIEPHEYHEFLSGLKRRLNGMGCSIQPTPATEKKE